MSEYAIALREATKWFGEKCALDHLSVCVPVGSVFGFLGPNGAGKTTAIRAVMGHLHLAEGEVATLGSDPWSHDEAQRQRVAYVSENMNVPGWMTAERAVRFCSAQYPKWDRDLAQQLLDKFELRKAGCFQTLSKGQKRRTAILLALCQNADLLVMDEPASGLDMVARHDFLERVIDVACSGDRTVFISSHMLSDLERVVDRIAIISQGRLRLEGDLDALKAGARKIRLPAAVPRGLLEAHFNLVRFEEGPEETLATVLDFDEERFRALCQAEAITQGAHHAGLGLEDLFVEVQKGDCVSPEEEGNV